MDVFRLTHRGGTAARLHRVLGMGVATVLIGLSSSCSSPQSPATTTTSTRGQSTTTQGKPAPRSPSPPLAAGIPVPGYRVGPLSFVSPSRGFGLVEFDTTGLSTAQQLVDTENGGSTWQAATSAPLPVQASILEFTDSENGYAWGSQGLDVTHDGGRQWTTTLATSNSNETVSPIGSNVLGNLVVPRRGDQHRRWEHLAEGGPTTRAQSGAPEPGQHRRCVRHGLWRDHS